MSSKSLSQKHRRRTEELEAAAMERVWAMRPSAPAGAPAGARGLRVEAAASAGAGSSPRIYIYDEIGMWGIRPRDVLDQIANLSADTLDVHINSPGGDVFDGIAIYNVLKDHPAKVRVVIDGLAASIASVIALAGDEILMPRNAEIMVHKPWSFVVGNASSMRKEAEILDTVERSILATYEEATGLPRAELESMLAGETWLTAEEAIEKGFATGLLDGEVSDEDEARIAAMDLSRFSSVPERVAARVTGKRKPGNHPCGGTFKERWDAHMASHSRVRLTLARLRLAELRQREIESAA